MNWLTMDNPPHAGWRLVALTALVSVAFLLGAHVGQDDKAAEYRHGETVAATRAQMTGLMCWAELNHTQPHGYEVLCGAAPAIPHCVEDDTLLVASGQYVNGYWTRYKCAHDGR